MNAIPTHRKLHLFYVEPDDDRWLPFDRYPRRLIRNLIRRRRSPGGQKRVFLNLCSGLEKLRIPYRINAFRHARRNPELPVGIVGKPHVLDMQDWKNPILFGASTMSHPIDAPDLFEKYPIKRVLVPGEWMRAMCAPYWGKKVMAWPVGIDTDRWSPATNGRKDLDILIYNKILWKHSEMERCLVSPIRNFTEKKGFRFSEITYGHYREEDFEHLLQRAKAMIFICEHETQGIAYQQALSCSVPIFAWDRQGHWKDPAYYPHRVKFAPVTSVPYWDKRCGCKFADFLEFQRGFPVFWESVQSGFFSPRDFILENLTLEKAARAYLGHWAEAFGQT